MNPILLISSILIGILINLSLSEDPEMKFGHDKPYLKRSGDNFVDLSFKIYEQQGKNDMLEDFYTDDWEKPNGYTGEYYYIQVGSVYYYFSMKPDTEIYLDSESCGLLDRGIKWTVKFRSQKQHSSMNTYAFESDCIL